MSRTIVIAEIGENHVGDWDRARRMVVAAARAGADIVKFQSYRGADVPESDPEKEWFSRVELPDSLHVELLELARRHGVEFLSSPFTVERARSERDHVQRLPVLGDREVSRRVRNLAVRVGLGNAAPPP